MRAALTLVCAAIVALASASHADVAAVWPSLAPGSTLYGRFTQEQYLKGLTAPLKTEGDFVVVPARGIIWRSAQPVRSVTVITAAGMRAIVGDWSALRQDFAVTCSGDRNAWRVILTPLDSASPLAARLTSVVLTGD